jgi:SET domain-containing protein
MNIEALIVQKSPIEGLGVFAGRNFERGETICVFEGQKVSVSELRARFRAGQNDLSCDAFQIGEADYLLIESPYVYVNHSCTPNAAFKEISELVATAPIKKGEELFFDYSTTEWTPQDYTQYDHTEWPMRCECGSNSCRKLVTCFPYIPEETREKYITQGVIQNYIHQKSTKPLEQQRCYVCEEAIGRLRRGA